MGNNLTWSEDHQKKQLNTLTGMFAEIEISEPVEGFGERPQDVRKCVEEAILMIKDIRNIVHGVGNNVGLSSGLKITKIKNRLKNLHPKFTERTTRKEN